MPPSPDRRRAAHEARARVAAAAARRSRRRRRLQAAAALSLVGLLLVGAALQLRRDDTADARAGVLSYVVPPPSHVTGAVAYAVTPPVGGDHAGVWQNCGAYDDPVRPEQAVHSMEHGAVWLTYAQGLSNVDLETVEAFAHQPYVLVSPWLGALPGRVVASAWGKQLVLDEVDAPKIEAFLRDHRQSDSAPEPGAPCTGGAGEPL